MNWPARWTSALRAANWAIGLELVRSCPPLPPTFWPTAYEALFDHGTFIESHLENTYEVTSNHFLSNVVGLFFLAAMFDDLPRGSAWDRQCRSWLAEEMDVQVLPDGADYESSVPYHRLVTELFLGAARLADYKGTPLRRACLRRVLSNMVDFLAAVKRPDGLMPQIGDADDGRLHVLSGYGTLAAAGCAASVRARGALSRRPPEWIALARARSRGRLPGGVSIRRGLAVPNRRRTRSCGTFPRRTDGDAPRRATTCSSRTASSAPPDSATTSTTTCSASSTTSMALPVLVDPGSYVYTSDPDARNLFRSTRVSQHAERSTVEEQNEIRPEWLFRMFEKADPEHLDRRNDGRPLEYRGRHRGYARLPQPVVHERTFTLPATTAR